MIYSRANSNCAVKIVLRRSDPFPLSDLFMPAYKHWEYQGLLKVHVYMPHAVGPE